MSQEHDDAIKKEFEKSEGISNLGKVEMGKNQLNMNDPEIKRLHEIAGHQTLDLSQLPSKGKFYRDDLRILIRPARVGEIREFSTLDENNLKDVDDRLNSIMVNCVKIMYDNGIGSYKDVLEEDRIYVILSVRELTFKQGENKLMMPVTKKACKNSTCKSQSAIELRTENLQFFEVSDVLEKYYDEVNRCYSVQTKNYGVITLAPPTIGVMRAITDFARQREEKNLPWDKSMLAVLPYLQREWRNWDKKAIFESTSAFQGWDTNKYALIYRLAEQMKIGVNPEMIFPCNECGEEVTVPLSFPGGIKSLFIISDITSELL